jgi:hypothetical protein
VGKTQGASVAYRELCGLGRDYSEARTDTTQQSGQTPDKKVEIKNNTQKQFTSRAPRTDKNTKHSQMTYTCGHILRNNTNSTNANQREE